MGSRQSVDGIRMKDYVAGHRFWWGWPGRTSRSHTLSGLDDRIVTSARRDVEIRHRARLAQGAMHGPDHGSLYPGFEIDRADFSDNQALAGGLFR
jgi:hypothetical protein